MCRKIYWHRRGQNITPDMICAVGNNSGSKCISDVHWATNSEISLNTGWFISFTSCLRECQRRCGRGKGVCQQQKIRISRQKKWSACHIRRLQLKAHARFCKEYRLAKIGSWLLENDKKSFGFSLGSLCSFEENLRNKLCAPIVKKEHDNNDIHNLSLIFVGFVADFNFVVIIISLAIDWV